jgi:hypothetical protein
VSSLLQFTGKIKVVEDPEDRLNNTHEGNQLRRNKTRKSLTNPAVHRRLSTCYP